MFDEGGEEAFAVTSFYKRTVANAARIRKILNLTEHNIQEEPRPTLYTALF